MPQVSMDCLGLLLLKVNDAAIHHELHQQYVRNSHPVAFFDESFEMDPARQRFYVIAVAVVHNDELDASREALSSFYGGRALHAAPMFDKLEFESLRQATRLASKQNDGMDVVIYPRQSRSTILQPASKPANWRVAPQHCRSALSTVSGTPTRIA